MKKDDSIKSRIVDIFIEIHTIKDHIANEIKKDTKNKNKVSFHDALLCLLYLTITASHIAIKQDKEGRDKCKLSITSTIDDLFESFDSLQEEIEH
jgi:hypothetical protein